MITSQEHRRVYSTIYRVYSNAGSEQYRALERLQSLTDEIFAFTVWLQTKPDRRLVDAYLDAYHLEEMHAYNVLKPLWR